LAEPNILLRTVSSIFDLSERALNRAVPCSRIAVRRPAGSTSRLEPSGERGGDDKSAEMDGLASFSAPRDRSAAEIGALVNLVNAPGSGARRKGGGITSILKSRRARV
jgi:hypothetical protein